MYEQNNTLAARKSKVETVKAYFIWTLPIKHTLACILNDQFILTKVKGKYMIHTTASGKISMRQIPSSRSQILIIIRNRNWT